jgi:hypothetical protein
MLSDLHITDFRGVGDLRLDNLGRVNLIPRNPDRIARHWRSCRFLTPNQPGLR